MGRTTWFDVDGMKRGEWTEEEDRMLVAYINKYGLRDWGSLPRRDGLHRCGKSCRLRWLNYLKPGIKRGKFTPQEEEDIIKFHSLLGNRWAAIAKQMPNRTDNDIKNHWHSCLKKRLRRSGIDPMTHEPIITVVKATSSSTTSSPKRTHSSSTSSVRLLNKLACGVSSRKLGLDRIKTVMMISSEPRQYVEEEKMMISSKKEEEEVIGCVVEIDENLISTTSIHELACDSIYYYDESAFENYDLYHETYDQLDHNIFLF